MCDRKLVKYALLFVILLNSVSHAEVSTTGSGTFLDPHIMVQRITSQGRGFGMYSLRGQSILVEEDCFDLDGNPTSPPIAEGHSTRIQMMAQKRYEYDLEKPVNTDTWLELDVSGYEHDYTDMLTRHVRINSAGITEVLTSNDFKESVMTGFTGNPTYTNGQRISDVVRKDVVSHSGEVENADYEMGVSTWKGKIEHDENFKDQLPGTIDLEFEWSFTFNIELVGFWSLSVEVFHAGDSSNGSWEGDWVNLGPGYLGTTLNSFENACNTNFWGGVCPISEAGWVFDGITDAHQLLDAHRAFPSPVVFYFDEWSTDYIMHVHDPILT